MLLHELGLGLFITTQQVILYNNVLRREVDRRNHFFPVQSVSYIPFSPVHFHTRNFLPRRDFYARYHTFPSTVKEQLHPHHSSGVSRCHYRFYGFFIAAGGVAQWLLAVRRRTVCQVRGGEPPQAPARRSVALLPKPGFDFA